MDRSRSMALGCLLVALMALGVPAEARPKIASLTSSDLDRFYGPMFADPYAEMFDARVPDKEKLRIGNRELGPFIGGVRGILYYWSLVDCFAAWSRTGKKDFYDLSGMEKVSAVPVFLKPAKDEKEFGQVNPAFISWVAANMLPLAADRIKEVSCREIYNKLLRRFFRLMAESHAFLEKGQLWDAEAKAYEDARRKARFEALDWLAERYAKALPAYGNQDGVTFTGPMAIGFWLRRHLDQTAPLLHRTLQDLLRQYDPQPW